MVYRMEYLLRIEAEGPDYLRVPLGSSSGPFATRDYLASPSKRLRWTASAPSSIAATLQLLDIR